MARSRANTTIIAPDYAVVAFIRDGRFAAVASVLAVLHARGLVVAGRTGVVHRSESVTAPPDGLERQVWLAMHGAVSPGALTARPGVDSALNELRRRARTLGLVRWLVPIRGFLPARTRLGRRLLDSAWSDFPWPPTPEAADAPIEERVGMAVALYGNVALMALMPQFARDSGLLSRAGSDGHDWVDPQAADPQGRYF